MAIGNTNLNWLVENDELTGSPLSSPTTPAGNLNVPLNELLQNDINLQGQIDAIVGAGSGPSTFTELTDTPSSFTNNQILETTGSSVISVPKATGYNKNTGTTAGTIATGDHAHVKADISDFAHTHVLADITDYDPSVPTRLSDGSHLFYTRAGKFIRVGNYITSVYTIAQINFTNPEDSFTYELEVYGYPPGTFGLFSRKTYSNRITSKQENGTSTAYLDIVTGPSSTDIVKNVSSGESYGTYELNSAIDTNPTMSIYTANTFSQLNINTSITNLYINTVDTTEILFRLHVFAEANTGDGDVSIVPLGV